MNKENSKDIAEFDNEILYRFYYCESYMATIKGQPYNNKSIFRCDKRRSVQIKAINDARTQAKVDHLKFLKLFNEHCVD